jgi:2,3-bisphosphoglycerate-independent phosphoglycerate mutase
MKPVCLAILDGWGINPDPSGNAPLLAKTPNLDALFKEYPATALKNSGLSVGLPDGQMGNSEVGHLTMGAGRVVYQELTKINLTIESGSFFREPALARTLAIVKQNNKALHLMGLVSDGGVHSHIGHLFALLDAAKCAGLDRVYIHVFLDGRDTPPTSGAGYVRALVEKLKSVGIGEIATISGRYYAMDRDRRWERVAKAYDAMVLGKGEQARDAVSAPGAAGTIEESYKRNVTDEFVKPTVILGRSGRAKTISDGDSVIFFNFRADRARELARALTDPGFDGFERERVPGLGRFLCMTEYDNTLKLPVIFESSNLKNILGEVLANKNVAQFRVSETEKYAHVTFFFNGGVEAPFPGEERLLIPSVKDVPTYDLAPAMRSVEIADAVVKKMEEGKTGFVLLNIANGDMVGHTGVLGAAIAACEAVDRAVGRIADAARKRGWSLIVTSDHGNVEKMFAEDNASPQTAHTTNLVPFILVDDALKGVRLREGGALMDIAPTVLKLMGIEKPAEMTGTALY